jgi:acyl carrier protein
MLCESYALREGQTPVLVAIAQGIWFRRVSLRFTLANHASLAAASPPNSLGNALSEQPTWNNIETMVAGIVARACKLDLSFKDDFDSFSIDPRFRLELYHGLKSVFSNIHLHLDDISNCTNIRAIVELVFSRSIASTIPSLTTQPISFSASNSVDLTKEIRQIFAHVLDMDEDSVGEDMELGSLGLDSLSCLEAIHLLATRYGAHLSANFIHSCTTIRDVQNRLSSSGGVQDGTFSSSTSDTTSNLPGGLDFQKKLWCLQKAISSRTPLVLIHDGSGLAACYRHLPNISRDLYGISNPRFLSSQVWSSINELAATYAGYIQQEIDGPVLVGGEAFLRIRFYILSS